MCIGTFKCSVRATVQLSVLKVSQCTFFRLFCCSQNGPKQKEVGQGRECWVSEGVTEQQVTRS